MDNPELILQSLEHFPKLKDEADYSIPLELEEYIHYVAKTGDPVFQWTLVKPLFREKMIKVVTDFFESTPGEIPDYPNVNKFNYDSMKSTLLERIDWFKGAPFTIQRISELLVNPTKEYNRVDKYMRALEKNIYVVSTREPGMPQPVEENSTTFEESFILNGNDFELKSDNAEMSGSKVEDGDAAALLLLKKCNSESDDSNFNIEVDVTNTTPSEDAQVAGIVEGGEINVQDVTSNPSESSEDTLNVSEEKCGQTRKLEEDEEHCDIENEPKRFKMDSEDKPSTPGEEMRNFENKLLNIENEPKQFKSDSEEKPSTQGEEMKNFEKLLNEAETPSESQPQNTTQEDQTSKADIEMELEETVDSKIESFDNIQSEKNNSSLNVSDSMVISPESSILDSVSNDAGTQELKEMWKLLESDDLNAPEKSNDDIPQSNESLNEKQEETVSSSNDIVLDTAEINDETTIHEKDEGSSEANHGVDNEIDDGLKAISESTPSDEISDQENVIDEADSSASLEESENKKEETTPISDSDKINIAPTEQSIPESSESKASEDIIEEDAVESTSEISPEIEEAILQEDEYETQEPEEAGSNIDPLSTETVESEQPGEASPSSVVEGANVDASSGDQQEESTTEQTE